MDGAPFELPEERILGNLGVGLTGPIGGYIGRTSSLQLGKYTLNNIISSFPNYEDATSRVFSINRNGNIGLEIVKRFNVVFDYNRSAMYVKPITPLEKSFEHDMAGVEIDIMLRSRSGRSFVIDVASKDGKNKERIKLTIKKRI